MHTLDDKNIQTAFKIILILFMFVGMKLKKLLDYSLPASLPHLLKQKMTLLDKMRNINATILEQNEIIITKDLLFGSISLDDTSDTLMLDATGDCLISMKVSCLCFSSVDYIIIFFYHILVIPCCIII